MKARLIIILFAVLSFLFPEKLISQKIYLSPNGSDNNEGSVEKPLATLNAAREKAQRVRKSGPDNQLVEIIALGGEYFMMQPLILSPDDGGTKASPLIIRSETGQKVLFRGGVPVTGFAKINEKLWKAFVPQVAFYNSYFEQLYVNGKRATRARTPDSGFFNSGKVEETILEKGTGSFSVLAVQKITIDSSDMSYFNSFTPQDYQDALIVFYHNWDNTRKRITGFGRENSSVYTVGEGMKPWNPINEKSRYIVENYRAALNAPGEWFLDRTGYLYYVPQEGETIENTTFIAPVLKEFIVIRGDQSTGKKVENISFENVSFGYAGYQTPPSGNEPAQAAFNADAVVTLDFANNISFTNQCR